MQLPNSGNQSGYHPYYVADGTITTGGTSQLLLPRPVSMSFLHIQNISSGSLYVEFGDARGTATVSGGALASIAVTNGGFGYTIPPQVFLFGGGNPNSTSLITVGQPNYPSPAHPAAAHAVLGGGIVTSFVVDDPGSNYIVAPMVFLVGHPLDPKGVANPYFSSVNSGFILAAGGGNYYINGTSCPTQALSIWGATTGQAFTCRWMA